jgi:hypothetical protein
MPTSMAPERHEGVTQPSSSMPGGGVTSEAGRLTPTAAAMEDTSAR